MRELVLTCVMAMVGSGCVNVVSHIDEFDAGPDVKPSDASGEPEVSAGMCSSGMRWNPSNAASQNMNPGVSCISSGCHTQSTKNPFTMAGTIYALNGQHDDNNCNGLDGNGVAIAILDPDTNMEIPPRVLVNNVGNFFTNRMFPANYKVKVLAMGREAIMSAPITDRDGSCNFCHTPDNFMNAKGRITPQPP